MTPAFFIAALAVVEYNQLRQGYYFLLGCFFACE
jgi:hypothetical protein